MSDSKPRRTDGLNGGEFSCHLQLPFEDASQNCKWILRVCFVLRSNTLATYVMYLGLGKRVKFLIRWSIPVYKFELIWASSRLVQSEDVIESIVSSEFWRLQTLGHFCVLLSLFSRPFQCIASGDSSRT